MKKLGFGFMRLPMIESGDTRCVDIEKLKKLVDIFIGKGFNYFDTAYGYCDEKSEEALRETVVKRYPRESIIIADKMPTIRVKCPEDYPVFFQTQLERCGVDYFDYYLLHNIWKKSYEETEKFGGFEFMANKIKEGKIKHFGFSFHDEPELLEKVLKNHPEVEFVQLQINYLDWKSPTVRSEECYNIARKYGKDIFVMEPNKGGSLINLPEAAKELFGKYAPDRTPAQWAMGFVASLEGVKLVLSGMNATEQVEENTSFMDREHTISPEERQIIGKVAEIVEKSLAIACTKCRYCTEKCPMKIPIPEYFSAYNTYSLTHNMGNAGMYYRRYANGRALASECIKCGTCEEFCPQHLKIRDLLKEIANTFEV